MVERHIMLEEFLSRNLSELHVQGIIKYHEGKPAFRKFFTWGVSRWFMLGTERHLDYVVNLRAGWGKRFIPYGHLDGAVRMTFKPELRPKNEKIRRVFYEFFEETGYPMPTSEEWGWFYENIKK